MQTFWSRVAKTDEDSCWDWIGARQSKGGYGSAAGGYAHRTAYELHHGVVLTSEQVVRHKCDNQPCCNPAHLEIGTHADNVRDRVARGRSAAAERNGRAVLTEQLVIEILASVNSSSVLAKRYVVDPKTIRDIRDGKTWKHIDRTVSAQPSGISHHIAEQQTPQDTEQHAELWQGRLESNQRMPESESAMSVMLSVA